MRKPAPVINIVLVSHLELSQAFGDLLLDVFD